VACGCGTWSWFVGLLFHVEHRGQGYGQLSPAKRDSDEPIPPRRWRMSRIAVSLAGTVHSCFTWNLGVKVTDSYRLRSETAMSRSHLEDGGCRGLLCRLPAQSLVFHVEPRGRGYGTGRSPASETVMSRSHLEDGGCGRLLSRLLAQSLVFHVERRGRGYGTARSGMVVVASACLCLRETHRRRLRDGHS
jgi:hypothetical protein